MKWFKRFFPPLEGEKITTITIKKAEIKSIHINECIGNSSFINDDIIIDVKVVRDVGIFESPGYFCDLYFYYIEMPLNIDNDPASGWVNVINSGEAFHIERVKILKNDGTLYTFSEGRIYVRFSNWFQLFKTARFRFSKLRFKISVNDNKGITNG